MSTTVEKANGEFEFSDHLPLRLLHTEWRCVEPDPKQEDDMEAPTINPGAELILAESL